MTYRSLLTGSLLAIGCAAASGTALDMSPDWLIRLHLLTSLGGLLPLAGFLAQHWWRRRAAIGRHPNAILGYATLACLALLAVSGAALLRWTNAAPLRWLHVGATGLLLAGLAGHLTWRMRVRWWAGRARQRPFRYGKPAVTLPHALFLGTLAAAGLGVAARPADGVSPAAAAVPLAHASQPDHALFAAQACAACHADLTAQWRRSGHANAATNPYYLALTSLFIQEQGVEASRFCATCHNPVGLINGEVALPADRPADAPAAAGAAPAYAARALAVSLPIGARAAEGVTCALCHQAASAAEAPRNGTLRLAANAAPLPDGAMDRLVMRIAPDAHRAALQPEVAAQAQLCGACHNLHLPDGTPLETTYDEWLASPYPAQGVTCQECHMPPVRARRADSGLPRTVASHGGAPGRPSSLPGVADGAALLRQAAALELSWRASGGTLYATAVVTNTGAGHQLPTGANDLRQMWLQVTLADAAGRILWQSGGLDAYGALDPAAAQFRKVLGDASGRPISLHRIWVATQVLSDTTLAPLEARAAPYAVPLPETAVYPLTLTARLLYRDVSPQFAEFALRRPARDLPVWEMATTVVEIPAP